MTIADAASALVARGTAALHQLGAITLVLVELEELDGVPAVIDRDSNTLWIAKGLPLADAVFLVSECFDLLVGGTVVQTEDGELDVVPDVAVGAEGVALVEPKRPHLRLIK
jgi:hypothetical protein